MNHLSAVTWAQIILIQIGVILQIVALRAILKAPDDHQKLKTAEDSVGTEEAAEDTESTSAKTTVSKTNRPKLKPHPHPFVAHLRQTSKVAFKQSFKFREQSSLAHHRIEY